jgi:hypothetical protein
MICASCRRLAAFDENSCDALLLFAAEADQAQDQGWGLFALHLFFGLHCFAGRRETARICARLLSGCA